VGFAAPVSPAALSIQTVGADVQVSWTGAGTLEKASALTGPWTDSENQTNPQTVPATNTTLFFRLKQ
jgi:hypothetical protein